MIWAIGDLHGNTKSYEKICRRIHCQDPEAVTFQVGDVGIGFKGVFVPLVGPKDFYIAGNHDDALVMDMGCKSNYLGDFGHMEIAGKKIFWVRGAMSTDRSMRVEGESWWAYEELTYLQMKNAVELYQQVKPDIVISHDCPKQIREKWFAYRESGITVDGLTQMMELWQPAAWAFGHHHTQKDEIVDKTHFYCLGELQEKKLAI